MTYFSKQVPAHHSSQIKTQPKILRRGSVTARHAILCVKEGNGTRHLDIWRCSPLSRELPGARQRHHQIFYYICSERQAKIAGISSYEYLLRSLLCNASFCSSSCNKKLRLLLQGFYRGCSLCNTHLEITKLSFLGLSCSSPPTCRWCTQMTYHPGAETCCRN